MLREWQYSFLHLYELTYNVRNFIRCCLVLHNAVVTVAPKTAAAVGPCDANNCFSLSDKSCAKSSAILFAVTVETLPHPVALSAAGSLSVLVTDATDSPTAGASAAT